MKNFHFIGIGGVSMSALAVFLKQKGHFVTGSDINPNIALVGIDTAEKNKFANIEKADYVVTTGAILEDDESIVFAQKLGKKIVPRARLLGEIAKGFENVIAVSGTHGKTTTTAMLAEIFIEAGLEPTVHIGGISNKFKSNFLCGEKQFFITEACEYTNSFLALSPTLGVVLNVQPEHLDFFGTFENEMQSFLQFAGQSQMVVAPKGFGANAITFGKGGHFCAKNVRKTKNGFAFDVCKNGQRVFRLRLNSFIKKNIENALAACAVCDVFGVAPRHIQSALSNFCGVKLRAQVVCHAPRVIIDYAHHPAEIAAVIKSARARFGEKVLAVFQPHTFSRTRAFFGAFVDALCLADEVAILPTFAARENAIAGADAHNLFLAIRARRPARFFPTHNAARDFVLGQRGQTVLVLGAGNFSQNFFEKMS